MKEWMSRREPLMGSNLWNIFKLLIINWFRIHPKYWYRLFMTININLICLPLRIIQKIRFNYKLRKIEIRKDPIFIIGHWRTGTTFLHYILTCDKSKGFVPNQFTYAPHFSLVARNLARKLVDFAMPEKRPMDNVIIRSDLPGEEEFAMALTSRFSFYHAYIFPRKIGYFSQFLTFNETSNRSVKRWKKIYYKYIQKITYINQGKQLILKNPPNTARIKLLKEIFPEAKFIYLYRNPYEILASTIHLFNKLLPFFSLQKWNEEYIRNQIINNFEEMFEEYQTSKNNLQIKELFEIKYEDLILEPMKCIEKIYSILELDGFHENKTNFKEFIETQRNFITNIHEINSQLINLVNNHWKEYRDYFNYEKIIEEKRIIGF